MIYVHLPRNQNLIRMKKIIFTLVLASLLGSMASAQSFSHQSDLLYRHPNPLQQDLNLRGGKSWTTKLDSVTSETFSLSWTYNAQGQITRELFIDKFDPEYSWKEEPVFDSAGNIIRNNIFSYINNAWENTAYEEFEYNALGQRTQRINVNFFSGTWQVGGKGFYTYNADGKLTQYLQQLHVGSGNFEDLNRDNYYYDASGKLEKGLYFFYNAGWDSTYKDIVTYTGDLVSSYLSMELNAGSWENISKFNWIYTAANNAQQRDYFLPSGSSTWSSTQDQYQFRYDEATDASGILFPMASSYYGSDFQWFLMNHKRTDQDWYTINLNDGLLTFIETETYHYSPATNLGLSNTEAMPEVRVFPNPATDAVRIQFATQSGNVNMVMTDVTGKIVKAEELVPGQRISVSELPAACYFVVLSDDNGIVGRTKFIRE